IGGTRCAGVDGAGRTVRGCSLRIVAAIALTAEEVEELVLDDATAEAAAVLRLIELADLRVARTFADVRRIALRSENGAFEVVRSRARDGVHAAAGESALANVVRRDEELQLLDRVERHRLCARSAARRSR